MEINTTWIIFSLSFLVALTGAMSPGPLFTYTIIKSIQAKKLGFLMGFWIIIGHALLEMVIIVILLLGFSAFLSQPTVIKIIGVVGCGLLCYFGITMIRDLMHNKVPTTFLRNNQPSLQEQDTVPAENKEGGKVVENPILGGILVSMSNPYWWFWWAAIGFAFMIQYNISLQNIGGLTAFFFGHEAGDLIWYMFISILASLGQRALNKKIYYLILACCAVFMIGFGIYLGISPFLTL